MKSHYALGVALAAKGQHAEAIESYNRALQLDPDFQPARQAVEELSKHMHEEADNWPVVIPWYGPPAKRFQ